MTLGTLFVGLGFLLLRLVLCLLVLVVPSLLLSWTAYTVYRRRSFQHIGVLVFLNLLLFVTIWVTAGVQNFSTLHKVVDASYHMVFFLFLLYAILGFYTWAIEHYAPEPNQSETQRIDADY